MSSPGNLLTISTWKILHLIEQDFKHFKIFLSQLFQVFPFRWIKLFQNKSTNKARHALMSKSQDNRLHCRQFVDPQVNFRIQNDDKYDITLVDFARLEMSLAFGFH